MAPENETRFASAKILILEDNHGMRQIIWSVLNAFGCSNLTCCSDVGDAIERTLLDPPDLAIVDYQLNDETGLDFVRALRSSEELAVAGVPVIMVTAHTQIARINEFINAGVDEILAKPMQAETLYRRIAAVVNHRRPYVRTRRYFGPDRRSDATAVVEERRAEAPSLANDDDQDAFIVDI